jgi:fatty acid kinase fatty acid binding subunit
VREAGRVTVVTDSAAALPADLVARLGIRVVPLWLVIGDERHRDGDIALDELVSRFSEPIATSAPSPGEYATVIAEARHDGPVLVLTVSARMSSSFDAAVLAAKLVADDAANVAGRGPTASPERVPAAVGDDLGEGVAPDEESGVTVLDSGTAAGAQALVVLAAANAAAEGGSLPAVVAAAERVAARVRLTATVADLERLARSGRVPEAARWLGDRLGVRPLFEFRDGRARPLRPAFSAPVARERIVARCVADAPGRDATTGRLHVIVLHALDPEAAADLTARVERLAPTSCLVGPFSPVMVAHTGRGLAGLAWWWEA